MDQNKKRKTKDKSEEQDHNTDDSELRTKQTTLQEFFKPNSSLPIKQLKHSSLKLEQNKLLQNSLLIQKNNQIEEHKKTIQKQKQLRQKAAKLMQQSIEKLYNFKRKQKWRYIERGRQKYGHNDHMKKWVDGVQVNRRKEEIKKIQIDLQQSKDKEDCKIVLENQLQKIKSQLVQLEKQKKIFRHYQKLYLDQKHCKFNNTWPKLQNYLLCQLLGKGGFSEVYKAFDLIEFQYVAIKIHSFWDSWPQQQKNKYKYHAQRQFNTQSKLQHPNIAKVKAKKMINGQSNIFFCTIMQYCQGPDLGLYIKQNDKISETKAKAIINQVIDALQYLATRQPKVIHFDLKPQNIIFHKGIIKLVDFGLCRLMQTKQTKMQMTSPGVGTYWYLPPQCFDSDPKISYKVDIWSTGIIMYQMIYGKKPFGNDLSQQAILKRNVIKNLPQLRFGQSPIVTLQGKNFIRKCLAYKVEDRLDVLKFNELYFK